MKKAVILLSALILATQTLPAQVAGGLDAPGPREIVVQSADEGRTASVAWAVERFRTVGLELPVLDIFVHATKKGCDGHDGLYTPGAEVDRIDICTDSVFIILHELGHAWEYRYAVECARQKFLDELDLEAWTGASVRYRTRGVEVAANLIAWGLVARSLTASEVRAYADTLTRFESFTGVPSPRPID